MKKILEIIYALLVGLIGDDATEDETKALAELKAMIDELEGESKTEEEVVEERPFDLAKFKNFYNRESNQISS